MGGRGSSSDGASNHAGESRYKRLQAGETLHLKTSSGTVFDLHTKSFAGVTGYYIKQNGKAVPGYKGGKIMPKSEAVTWLSGLKSVKK